MMALAIAAVGGMLFGVANVSAAELHRGHMRDRIACIRFQIGGDRLGSTLDELVQGGTLTAEQKDAIVAKIAENMTSDKPCTGMGLVRDGTVGAAITDLLGMDRSDIRQAWMNDQSLTEIAATKGIDRQTLVDTIVNALGDRLDKAVEKGRITEERKSEIVANLTPVIEQAVDVHRSEVQARRDAGSDATPTAPSTPVSTTANTNIA